MEAATKCKVIGFMMTGVTMSSHITTYCSFSSTSPKLIVEYNKEQQFGKNDCIKLSVDGYNSNESSEKIEAITMNVVSPDTEALQKNLEKLDSIEKLDVNWNENGADKFSTNLIEKVRKVLQILKKQPEIFPTAEKSIQLEYEKEDGQYLEINIYENHTKIFSIDANEQETEFVIKEEENARIQKTVEDFHGKK